MLFMSFKKNATKFAWALLASFATFFGWMVFAAYTSSSATAATITRAVVVLDSIETRMATSERRADVHDEQIRAMIKDLEALPPHELTEAVKDIQTDISSMKVDIATIKAKQEK